MYNIGTNRLFYTSINAAGKNVSAEILTPQLKKYTFEMKQFENNVYYLDVVFSCRGSYLFSVLEDGVETHQDILHVSAGKYVIYPETDNIL